MPENARDELSWTESPAARLARLQGRPRAPKVELDDAAMTVFVDGEERYLTMTEFRAFRLLWQHRGELIRHRNIVLAAGYNGEESEWYVEQLEATRWGGKNALQSRSRNLMCGIRKVLGDAIEIGGRRGFGYRIERER